MAVVSESTARKFWPNQDPMGRTFRMASEKDRKLQIVGIARDAEFQIFGGAKSQPYFYLPYAQHFKGNTLMVFQLRSDRDLLSLIPVAEKTIHALAPQLPVFQVQTMRQGLYTMNGLLLFQIGASLAAIMGGLGLTLAVIGLYGVVSYAVGRRIHEIGLRMALGASRGSVFRMIYRQSVVIIAIGLGFGLAIALLVARAVRGFVTVSVWDPVTYIVVAVVLGLGGPGLLLFSCAVCNSGGTDGSAARGLTLENPLSSLATASRLLPRQAGAGGITQECSVKGRGPLGMSGVLEHVLYLVFGHTRAMESLGNAWRGKKATSGVSKLGVASPPTRSHKKSSL